MEPGTGKVTVQWVNSDGSESSLTLHLRPIVSDSGAPLSRCLPLHLHLSDQRIPDVRLRVVHVVDTIGWVYASGMSLLHES